MYLFLIILILLASVLMMLIVLVQNSKGGGLASGFSSSNQYMGVRKTTDFLEKATWTLAACMCFLSMISAAFITPQTTKKVVESEIQEQFNNAVKVDPNIVTPDFGGNEGTDATEESAAE